MFKIEIRYLKEGKECFLGWMGDSYDIEEIDSQTIIVDGQVINNVLNVIIDKYQAWEGVVECDR